MPKRPNRALVILLAAVFIIVGIAGLVLPLIQGVLFIVIGLLLISLYSPKLRALIDRHTIKYPKLHAVVRQAEEWMISIIGRP